MPCRCRCSCFPAVSVTVAAVTQLGAPTLLLALALHARLAKALWPAKFCHVKAILARATVGPFAARALSASLDPGA